MSPQTTRRTRTLKCIQATAIRLAVAEGLHNITTEAIAREAGISTRTFFNYYPYKEAAIMGPPPDYPVEATERFVIARGRLLDDLNIFMTAHLSRFLDERHLIADVLRLSETDPKLLALRQHSVLARRAQIAEMLRRRLPDLPPVMSQILASAVIAATNAATIEWAGDENVDLVAASHRNIAMILPAAMMLDERPE